VRVHCPVQVWLNWYTGQPTLFLPWEDSRPYEGGFKYNCLVARAALHDTGGRLANASVQLNDEECSNSMCALCRVTGPAVRVTVRGLCDLALFDRHYTYTIGSGGRPMYVGSHSSLITYDPTGRQWAWTDRKAPHSLATSHSPESSLLLGAHSVDFSGVLQDECTAAGARQLTVKLTTCQEGEFTCRDGQCVGMEQRCDQTSNCKDSSDEENCRTIVMKENYSKKIAPFTFDMQKQVNIPVKINISMTVVDVIKIKEVDHIYTLKFRLKLEWFDYRVKYHNLKKVRASNSLTLEEVNKLWIPNLVFENTLNNDAVEGTKDSEMTLTREDDFKRSGLDDPDEINIFDGKVNRITFEQIYTKTLQCVYRLQMYPFDTQVGGEGHLVQYVSRYVRWI
jgi:hypothetical protein